MSASTAGLVPRYCCRRRRRPLRSPLRVTGETFRPLSFSRAACSYSLHQPPAGPDNRRYEKDPVKCWDNFYKRHNDKFFKDRHYLEKDWGRYFSLCGDGSQSPIDPKVVLEVGCGAGNTLFPLLAAFPDVFVHACDFSSHAVELVKAHEAFRTERVNTFVCDVTKDDLCKKILPASVDVVTMIFMLSAVSPLKMPLLLQNIKNVLKPSGYLLFRDYAIGDFAQEKLANKGQMISENFYTRRDGTCAFYFSEDSLSTLFRENGFKPLEISVYCKQIVNRSRKIVMNRRWIRAAFCSNDNPDLHQTLTTISS